MIVNDEIESAKITDNLSIIFIVIAISLILACLIIGYKFLHLQNNENNRSLEIHDLFFKDLDENENIVL